MIEIQYIRQNPDEVISRLGVKNFDAKNLVSEILAVDTEKRGLQTKLDDILSQLNKASKDIGYLYKECKKQEVDDLKIKPTAWKTYIAALEVESRTIEQALQDELVL